MFEKNANLVDKHKFLDHRRRQESEHFKKNHHVSDLVKTLLTVEVNTTELCNRKCTFCPRFDDSVFPNRNLNMSVVGAQLIAERLASAGFRGKVSFSGFGENLLNPNFKFIISKFRESLPQSTIECNTNGDKLTAKVVDVLLNSGLDLLYINLYDGIEQIEKFDRLISAENKEKVKFRIHWDSKDHGLILNNRSGQIKWIEVDESEINALKGKPCYYPFYKMFVDWNGDVLFCSNDWGRQKVVGNLIQDSLENVWFSKAMEKIRKRLAKGDRSDSPCNKCNVGGTLFGKQSFEILNEHYKSSHNR